MLIIIVVGDSENNEGGYAFDYLTSMEDYIKNLMSIGGIGIFIKKIQDIPLITFFIKALIKILQIARNESGGVNHYVCISLFNTILEQYPEKLDTHVILFLKILWNELSNKQASKSYRLYSMQLLAYLFIYNSKLTLKTLTEMGMLIPICQNFFSSLRKYDDPDQLRSLIYGITCLIKTDVDALPDVIKAGMPKILESLVKLSLKYLKHRERQKADEIEEFISNKEEIPENIKELKSGQLDKLNEHIKNEKEDEEEENDVDEDDDDYLWSK